MHERVRYGFPNVAGWQVGKLDIDDAEGTKASLPVSLDPSPGERTIGEIVR
jgi:hypothetical protein